MVPFGKRRWLRLPHTLHPKPPNPETSETLLLCYCPQQAFRLADFWSKDKSHQNVADWTFKLSGIVLPWNLTNLELHKKRESQWPETNPFSRGHWCGCSRQRQPEKIMGFQGGDAEWLVSVSQIVSSHWETQAWFTEGPAKQLSNCLKNFLCIDFTRTYVRIYGFLKNFIIMEIGFPEGLLPKRSFTSVAECFPPRAWCPLSGRSFPDHPGGPSVHDNDASVPEQSDVSRNARSCPCEGRVGKEAAKSRINTKAQASSGATLRRAPLQCSVHLCPKVCPAVVLSCPLSRGPQQGP